MFWLSTCMLWPVTRSDVVANVYRHLVPWNCTYLTCIQSLLSLPTLRLMILCSSKSVLMWLILLLMSEPSAGQLRPVLCYQSFLPHLSLFEQMMLMLFPSSLEIVGKYVAFWLIKIYTFIYFLLYWQFHEPTTDLVETLLLQGLVCGTVCR